MSEVSAGYKYWVQYEGVPGGSMDTEDFWLSSSDNRKRPIAVQRLGDLPAPGWIALGDRELPRVLYILHHEDDEHPDDYVSRPYMTVLGFGRRGKEKYLDTPQTFSIGFVESTDYSVVDRTVRKLLKQRILNGLRRSIDLARARPLTGRHRFATGGVRVTLLPRAPATCGTTQTDGPR